MGTLLQFTLHSIFMESTQSAPKYKVSVVKSIEISFGSKKEPGFLLSVTDSKNASWQVARGKTSLVDAKNQLIATATSSNAKQKINSIPKFQYGTVEEAQKWFDTVLKSISDQDTFGFDPLFCAGRSCTPQLNKQIEFFKYPQPPASASETTVLVTGATGYIGSNTIRLLLQRGYNVVGTARSPDNESKVSHLTGLTGASQRLRLVKADLTDPASFEAAVKDVDHIFHIASPFISSPSDVKRDLMIPAIQGTLSVLRAATLYGNKLKTIVVTSSCASIYHNADFGRTPQNKIRDESVWNTQSNESVLPYSYSKVLAESAAWTFYEALCKKSWQVNSRSSCP